MGGGIHATVDGLVTTPWIYLALFALAVLDGFFPLVPAESLVITLGAWAASTGDPNLALIVLVAALGAFTGDHISFAIGRRLGQRFFTRPAPQSRTRRLYDRIGRMLDRRGGLVLVVARYIPGGRTATTLTTGATGYPRLSFTGYVALASATWASYSAGLGYLGGTTYQEQPLKGVALGLALAIAITAAYEAVRFVRRRRAGES